MSAGARVSHFHHRISTSWRLAHQMPDQDGGNGIHRRLLDSDVRDPRNTRDRGGAAVNARHLHNVRGSKSDADCKWLGELYSVGLLSASFRPVAELAGYFDFLSLSSVFVQFRARSLENMALFIQNQANSLIK
jgi:hypothetical protein